LKTILISSAVSIAIGFTFGWMIRSATVHLETIETELVVDKPKRPAPRSENLLDIPPERLNPSDIDRAISPNRPIPRESTKPSEAVVNAQQAKWNRLTEVLGLDGAQAKVLEAAIAESEPVPAEGQALDAAYAEAGEKLQATILATLNADQAKAFRELQKRTLQNQLNSKAMQQYVQELGKLDLDPSQLNQATEILLDRALEEAAAIPDSTRLLLDGSVLPIGDRKISANGFTLLRKLATSNSGGSMGIQEIAAIQRAEMARQMTQFEGVLTPAQLEIYQAGIKTSSKNLDMIAPRN